MSKVLHSPTANLLRHSRLFSLPAPLPQPSLDPISSSGLTRASETATLPYPIHQSIATPSSSRSRGDWGLKRALPTRKTDSSAARLRITGLDTYEKVTDFESAADHVQTLAKFQELDLPVLVKGPRNTVSGGLRPAPKMSVFEDSVDNTSGTSSARWKHTGPWVAGMSQGEFDAFLKRTVKSRKTEFLAFLKKKIVESENITRRQIGRNEGLLDEVEEFTEAQLTDDKLVQEIQAKRVDFPRSGLSSEISKLIAEFFDLPNTAATTEASSFANRMSTLNSLTESLLSSTDREGPPTTHPSAGLSYLRSDAFMDNHPGYGPQQMRSPVVARVLKAQTAANNAPGEGDVAYTAVVGIGGVVTTVSPGITGGAGPRSTFKPSSTGDEIRDRQTSAVHTLDPTLEGGNKVYLHPQPPRIDQHGRIRLEAEMGDRQAIGVFTGDIVTAPSTTSTRPRGFDLGSVGGPLPRLDAAPAGTSGNANFGHGLSKAGLGARREERAGIDEIQRLFDEQMKGERR
ncbi:hypothetical protein LTR66_006000 [Elasticomyces elasticus]|nr:hypothetical protein LTR66_006000 [Elasticomyces elasticus]